MSNRRQRRRDLRRVREGFALVASRGCVFCDGPADTVEAGFRNEPRKKGRLVIVAMCATCKALPDLQARLDAKLSERAGTEVKL